MATQTVTEYAPTFIPRGAEYRGLPKEIKLNLQASTLEAAKKAAREAAKKAGREAAKKAAKKELIQSIKAAVCEALQPRIDGLKKDMNDSKADFRKLHMCLDQVRKEQDELRTSQRKLHRGIDELHRGIDELRTSQDELRTSQDELRTSQDELRTSQDELRTSQDELRTSQDELRTSQDELHTLVNKLEKDNIELKAYNKRLSEKDFLHQIRQCCCEYQEYMKERTTLNTIAELHQAMWNCWPAEDKDSSLHKEIFAAELTRYADRLAEERSGLGSKGVVAADDHKSLRATQASDVLQRKVAFALSIRADYVCPHFLDQEFLIQSVNEFDEVTVGNQKVCFVDKPSWIALIKHIFERTPSLQPDVFEDVTYFVGTARTEYT
jgi:chromosome segregation ATPase